MSWEKPPAPEPCSFPAIGPVFGRNDVFAYNPPPIGEPHRGRGWESTTAIPGNLDLHLKKKKQLPDHARQFLPDPRASMLFILSHGSGKAKSWECATGRRRAFSRLLSWLKAVDHDFLWMSEVSFHLAPGRRKSRMASAPFIQVLFVFCVYFLGFIFLCVLISSPCPWGNRFFPRRSLRQLPILGPWWRPPPHMTHEGRGQDRVGGSPLGWPFSDWRCFPGRRLCQSWKPLSSLHPPRDPVEYWTTTVLAFRPSPLPENACAVMKQHETASKTRRV